MKVKCTHAVTNSFTVGKIYDMEVGTILKDDRNKQKFELVSTFEQVKQTPYEYLIEYYGLEEGKDYELSFRSMDKKIKVYLSGGEIVVDGTDVFDKMDGLRRNEILCDNVTFTEMPQKKTVTFELTDEQLEQIKKIIE